MQIELPMNPARRIIDAALESGHAGKNCIPLIAKTRSVQGTTTLKSGRLRELTGRPARRGAIWKVMLQTDLLDDEDTLRGALLARRAREDSLKTSTGLRSGGATREDVSLRRGVVGDAMGVKAAGGIRTREAALAMVAIGANRLGCSAIAAIVQ
jgi:deoxyribose-phosphate aldolase